MEKRGSAGGKATAKKLKAEAKKRIIEYNKHPHKCLNCGKPIYAPLDKKLSETLVKKYCDRSCSGKHCNIGNTKLRDAVSETNYKKSKLAKKTKKEIMKIYKESKSTREFFKKLELNSSSKYGKRILKEMGIDYTNIYQKRIDEKYKDITKEEIFKQEKTWTRARIFITKDAKKRFKKANKDKKCKCAICGYDKFIEVAHIKAVSKFDMKAKLTEINDPSNLIGLCPNHHKEYDYGLLENKELKKIKRKK